jgi:predicted glycoside hydrolase/deacetylase ChbG (UPF0249 family)
MKRLIVNADDLAADEARNAGIFEAIQQGRVTSVSLLPNGPAIEDALHRIRSLGRRTVSVGVHLNLSEGKPVSPDLRLLTGPDGFFLGKTLTHKLLMRSGDQALQKEIRREMSAQVQVLLDCGMQLHHLDGHQHVHLFPAAIAAAVRIAQEHKIPWMRIPEESPSRHPTDSLPEGLMEEARRFSEIARAARQHLKGTGISTPDYFRGLFLKGRLSSAAVTDLLQTLPEGLTEWMVHPGRVPMVPASGPFSGFSTPAREQELETLLHADFGLALSDAGVTLTPFPEEHR